MSVLQRHEPPGMKWHNVLRDGKSLTSEKNTDQATFKWATTEWLSKRTTWSAGNPHPEQVQTGLLCPAVPG